MVPLSIWAWILSRLIRSRKRSSMVRNCFDNWTDRLRQDFYVLYNIEVLAERWHEDH